MSLYDRLRDTLRPRRLDGRLDDEISFHIEQRIDDLMAQGATREQARREAERMFGNQASLRETTRDRDVLVWLQALLQDLRFALRNLRRSPSFTAVAILSLAFGIGVNGAIFTLVHGVLLEKLPVRDPERIVQVHAHFKTFENDSFNYPILRELERRKEIFAEVIAFRHSPVTIDAGGQPQRATMELVSGGYFSFFGARPVLGRLLDAEDDRQPGAHAVCVLSYEAWQRLFGGDPEILRRPIRIRGTALQIVGVAPPGFTGGELQSRYDVYAPTAMSQPLSGVPRDSATYIWLRVLGRLQPSVKLAEASARLAVASGAIESALPENRANKDAEYQLRDASHGFDSWRTELHDPLLVLMGAVVLVLLVACANLANLLLARGAERRQETAIKLAIGSSRGRIMRQLLLETGLLAGAGGALSLLLASVLTRLILSMFNSGDDWRVLQVAPNLAVLAFTFGACLATILLAGLYPAWRASMTDAGPSLKGGAMPGGRAFMRRSLILVQVMLTVVLVFGASLFSHSLRNLKTIDLGYRIDHILSVQIGTEKALKPGSQPVSPPVLREMLEHARQIPGVESAALTSPGILSGTMMSDSVKLRDAGAGERQVEETHFVITSPKFFDTLRTPILRGRDFSAADGRGAPPVAIVNQRLASAAWPGEDPIGKRFDGWGSKNIEVIGVIGDTREHRVRDAAVPTAYLDFDQQGTQDGALEMRCAAPLAAVESAVRKLVKAAAPGYRVVSASSVEVLRDNQIHQERLLAFLSTLFGVLGTSLALVGIYGLIAYSVKRRTREIGIRVSVGAQKKDVLWLFVREASVLVAAGMLLGVPVALLLARFVGKLLYDVSTFDPAGVASTVALLALGGLAAALIPARGAVRVSPMEALRYD